jgi:hypothetical protein
MAAARSQRGGPRGRGLKKLEAAWGVEPGRAEGQPEWQLHLRLRKNGGGPMKLIGRTGTTAIETPTRKHAETQAHHRT